MFDTLKKIALYLTANNLTLATAESCTGGLISGAITSLAGSSQFFKGSIIAYSNEIKIGILNVKESTLVTHGAVSKQTVEEMVCGVCELLHTDCGIAVSGIAGPGGGTVDKPVGLVHIGIKVNGTIASFSHIFHGNRDDIRNATVKVSLIHLLSDLHL